MAKLLAKIRRSLLLRGPREFCGLLEKLNNCRLAPTDSSAETFWAVALIWPGISLKLSFTLIIDG